MGDKLHGTVGGVSHLGRTFTEEEVTEAWLTCQAQFEEQAANKQAEEASRKKEKKDADKAVKKAEKALAKEEAKKRAEGSFDDIMESSKKDLNNVDLIVRHIIRKCEDSTKAEKFFDQLHNSVGEVNKMGRTFTEEDVTEAWLRCQDFFEEQAKKAKAAAEAQAAEG